ncbi:MAG: carboxypeptidase regulatory-like domain-containing protein [Verrucomicrobia bacterium]|nr:carboxypeptidase regulatory-like domain-containing protein [Verrucomicrobiota bacterium]
MKAETLGISKTLFCAALFLALTLTLCVKVFVATHDWAAEDCLVDATTHDPHSQKEYRAIRNEFLKNYNAAKLRAGVEGAIARREIRIRVLGPDGKPMRGANVHSGIWTKEPFSPNRYYVCDAQGLAVVELPRTLDILRIWVDVDGYVPLWAHWEQEWQADGHLIPEEFTFKLPKGAMIGGFIKNEDGQPIQGARVEVRIVGGIAEPQNCPIFSPWLAYGDGGRITDAQGRWTLNNVPTEVEVSVKLSHPDYISDFSWGVMQKAQDLPTASLRQKTATLVMTRGIRVTGSVSDPEGKPAAGAVVVWGDDPYQQTSSRAIHTDAKGVYRLPPLPLGPMTVRVGAEGCAPDLKKITITRENPPVNFHLKRQDAPATVR